MSTLRMRVLGCVLFFGLCFQNGQAQQYYQVDYSNYMEVTRAIYNKYRFFMGDRVDSNRIRTHILQQLNARTYDPDLARPQALCTGKQFQRCLFRWNFLGAPFLVGTSYLDFYDGQTGAQTVASPGAMLHYSINQHTLYTFFREMGDGRSSMEIIIVDKDAFSVTTQVPQPAFSHPENLLAVSKPILQPNIIRNFSRLSFYLSVEGRLQLQIVETNTGRKHAIQAPRNYFPSGPNELELDLSDLPAGHYQCLLFDGTHHQVTPFVKLE